MTRQQQSVTQTGPSKSQTSDPALRDPIKGLKFRYRHGLDLLKKFPVGAKRGRQWPERPPYNAGGEFKRLAERLKIPLPELHSRRRFAFLYSEGCLDRLCRYEFLLSWSAIRWLLRVESRKQRSELEAQAVSKKWTAARLKVEVRQKTGTRGRTRKLPTKAPDGVKVLSEQSERFEQLLKTLVTGQTSLMSPSKARVTRTKNKREKLQLQAKEIVAALEEFRRLLGIV